MIWFLLSISWFNHRITGLQKKNEWNKFKLDNAAYAMSALEYYTATWYSNCGFKQVYECLRTELMSQSKKTLDYLSPLHKHVRLLERLLVHECISKIAWKSQWLHFFTKRKGLRVNKLLSYLNVIFLLWGMIMMMMIMMMMTMTITKGSFKKRRRRRRRQWERPKHQ